jgi:hypothetical protein
VDKQVGKLHVMSCPSLCSYDLTAVITTNLRSREDSPGVLIDDVKCEMELPAVAETGITVPLMVASVLIVFSKAILAIVPILERTIFQRSVSASVANENLQMDPWSPSIGIGVSFGQPMIAESISTICCKINDGFWYNLVQPTLRFIPGNF